MASALPDELLERAVKMRARGQALSREAEELWRDVQELTGGSENDANEARAKVERLKEVKQIMTTTSAEFIKLLDDNPGLALKVQNRPQAMTAKRKSILTTQSFDGIGGLYAALGGRVVQVPVESKLITEIECVILEPKGKMLAPRDYVTTGVVICLQGMPPSSESLNEWCEAAQAAEWLRLGATVAIPNMQVSTSLFATDLAAIVDAICDFVSHDQVLLVGKDMVSLRILELAVLDSFDRSIAGVVLLGPSSPPPDVAARLPAPLFLLWAKDDDISPFEDFEAWVELLENAQSVATIRECESGGHSFSRVLANPATAEAVRNFFVSSMLIVDLLADDEAQQHGHSTPASKSRIEQLTSELPVAVQKSSEAAASPGGPTRHQRLSISIAEWINGGMRNTSSSE
mmetsp:Transcript_131742/g.340925  ORF Transcript_131742/g.340925 Transcript_131742/m.340925 type:complete len:403 (+) Transcript_131742:112-1320(+)